MPKFPENAFIAIPALRSDLNNFIVAIRPYINTSNFGADLEKIQSEFKVTVALNPLGAQDCPIGDKGTIPGRPDITGKLNYYVEMLGEAFLIASKGQNNGFNLDIQDAAEIRNILCGMSTYMAELANGYLSQNIDGIYLDSYEPLIFFEGWSDFRNRTCFIPPPPALKQQCLALAGNAQVVCEGFSREEAEPPATPNTGVSIDSTGTANLLKLLEGVFRTLEINFTSILKILVIIEQGIKTTVTTIQEIAPKFIDVLKRIHDQRVELKEARQGIKDIMGLDTKFYPDSVSLIQLLARLNEIHQQENDVLYEIRVRSEEIKSYVEATRLDTQTINPKLDQMIIQITDNFSQTNTYINNSLDVVETNILERIEQMRQEQYQQTLAIIETINRIDTSVGT